MHHVHQCWCMPVALSEQHKQQLSEYCVTCLLFIITQGICI